MSEWLNNLLGGKKEISKEASQTDAKQEFQKKAERSPWLGDVMEIDEIKLRAEAEAKFQVDLVVRDEHLKKQAAYEAFETTEETLKRDYARDVAILSDYALAEMVAEIRGHNNQDFMEKASEYKEEAKKDVKSDRKAVEKELLENVGMSAQVDWQKAFEKYQKKEKPKEAKEKELYEPKLDKVDDKLSEGGKEKDYSQTDKEHIESMQGIGREEDTRTEVTEQAVPVQKEASLNKEAIGRGPEKGDITVREGEPFVVRVEGFDDPLSEDKVLNLQEDLIVTTGWTWPVNAVRQIPTESGTVLGVVLKLASQKEYLKTATLVRDPDVELKIGTIIELARSVMAKCGTILPQGSKWQIKSIDGFHYNISDDKNNYIISSHDTPKFDKIASIKKEARGPFFQDLNEQAQQRIIEEVREHFLAKGLQGQELDEEVDNFINIYNDGDSLAAIMRGDFRSLAASLEITNRASKEDVLKKVAECQSPWKVVEKDGQPVIARVVDEQVSKESEEEKKDDLKK